MDGDDSARAVALRQWTEGRSGDIGVSLDLSGPFEHAGQDPEFVLRLEGPRRLGEVLLFRGGLVMLHSFVKEDPAPEMEILHLADVTPEQLTAALDELGSKL